MLVRHGVVLGIHRAPIQGPRVGEIARSVVKAAEAHPGGLVQLGVFRLSPEFPLTTGFDSNTAELADLLRAIDSTFVACANVLEFGGVRAAAMRVATRAVCLLARPRASIETFDRLSDGIAWLLPHARLVGAHCQAPLYLELYREADRLLALMDREGWHIKGT
jgi:hypothetical protein